MQLKKKSNLTIYIFLLISLLNSFSSVNAQFNCGSNITITHNSLVGGNAYEIAPVTKTVTYGTVLTNLSGSYKCWTIKNLGADVMPTSTNDNREIAAGWYWQFNRKQGYKHDGTTRTPNSIWNSSINENSDWLLANDPCNLLLGNNWRIPTNTEWTNADISGNWNYDVDCFNSVLKMHTSGFLSNVDGSIITRGYNGDFWSSNQSSNSHANRIGYNATDCYSNYNQPYKSYAFNLRCIKDSCSLSVNLGNDTTICQGNNISLNANNTGCTYLWNTGQTSQTINVTTTGIYSVKVTNSSGCFASDTIMVTLNSTVANFNIPDTICVNQPIIIQNTTTCGSTYYWNFDSGSLSNNPLGANMGNIGILNRPVYSTIVKDGNNYYVFITNTNSGTITKLYFGNSLTNNPISTNLGSFGVLPSSIEGIQIKKDSITGLWIGLVLAAYNNNLVKLNFGNSINNVPTASNIGNISNVMSYPHTIYTFYEGGNWYSFVVNNSNNTLLKLSFGNSLTNNPTAINLGNIGGLNGPVGLYPIQENGIWYLFIVNRDNNSISRLNFGSSLLNIPTGVNLGNIGNTFNMPRSISILRDCGQIFGFIVNETTNDIVKLSFPNGLLNPPNGVSLGNIANFSFPHHISEIIRGGDSLYCLITNVNNNTMSKLCFYTPNNSSIASSNIETPPLYSYNSPGNYSVNLAVNEGLPNQSNICKEVVVVNNISVNLGNDTTICQGNNITLNANNPGCTYLWNTGQTSQTINVTTTGIYSVKVTNSNGCFASDTITVTIIPNPIVNLGNDTIICQNNLILNAGNIGCKYLWNTGDTTQMLNVTNTGIYFVKVTNNGCFASDTINISIISNLTVNIGNDTTICEGEEIVLNAVYNNSIYNWSNGATTQEITLSVAGKYWLTVNYNNCIGSDTINLNIIAKPIISLGNDTIMCPGDLIVLTPGIGYNNYLWSDGSFSSSLFVSNPGTYFVKVFDGVCYATDEIFIEECNSEIWVPNVFTPNGDGVNETFFAVCTNVNNITLTIFNRWGNEIYNGFGKNAVWDGKYCGENCPDGVYYYIIEYEQKGKDKGVRKLHGSVTLLH